MEEVWVDELFSLEFFSNYAKAPSILKLSFQSAFPYKIPLALPDSISTEKLN
jgi:hypothetical protein